MDGLPADCSNALSYDDGNPIGQRILARFPRCKLIPITTVPGANNYRARECDCESGAFSVQQAAQWAHVKSEMEDQDPWAVYVEVAMKEQLSNELSYHDLEFGKNVFCHLAWWNGNPVIPEGIVHTPWGPVGTGLGNIGCQYHRDGPLTWDVSVMLGTWVTPPPPAPPPAKTQEDFLVVRAPTHDPAHGIVAGEICLCSAAGAVNLGNDWPGIQADYKAAGVPLVLHESVSLLERFTRIAAH